MAIKVVVNHDFPLIGVTLINFIISINGTYSLEKIDSESYYLAYKYSIYYTDTAYSNKQTYMTTSIKEATPPSDIGNNMYTYIYGRIAAALSLGANDYVAC